MILCHRPQHIEDIYTLAPHSTQPSGEDTLCVSFHPEVCVELVTTSNPKIRTALRVVHLIDVLELLKMKT